MSAAPHVVFVTGGCNGLGHAFCAHLASLGHTVIGACRDGGGDPNGWTSLVMDVTDEASVRDTVDRVIDRFGRIDVVVNNAGLGIQGAVEDIDVDTAKRVFDTNLFGVHRVCRAVLPQLRAQGWGRIINISSIAANFGLPYRSFYSASKAALDRYSEALRMEVRAFGVVVVVVEPGGYRTNIANARLRPTRISRTYHAGYTKAMQVLDGEFDQGYDPIVCALAVSRIIEAPRPRPLYRPGQFGARFSVFLRWILPVRWFERLVEGHFR